MLFGSTMLEVALALVLVYMIIGVVCAAMIGMIEVVTRQRRKFAWYGIIALFDGDSEIARQLSSHPLIRPLGARPGRWPPSISAHSFALALLDIVAPSPLGESKSLVYVWDRIAAIPNEYLRHALSSLSFDTQTTSDLLTEIGNLYDSTMERMAVAYRRRVYLTILVAAFLLSLALNADTINIANSIPRYVDLRANLLSSAEPFEELSKATPSPSPSPSFYPTTSPYPETNPSINAGASTSPVSTGEALRETKKQIDEVNTKLNTPYLPIGWARNPVDPRTFPITPSGWIFKTLGILITTLVASIIGQGLALFGGSTENRQKITRVRDQKI